MDAALRMDARLARRIGEKREHLQRQRPLHPDVVRKLHDHLRVLLTYHSNAIEGNTLDLSETQLVIEQGLTIGGHTLSEHLEAVNHAEAFTLLLDLVQGSAPITPETVLQLHAVVMDKLLQSPGTWRSGPVFILGSTHRPPPAHELPELMARWSAWLIGDGFDYAPIERATLAHEMLLAVHPFLDGNGRTARLILNLMLMREGYPAVLLLNNWRISYIQALEAAHHARYGPLLNVVGRAVEAGLDLMLEAVDDAPRIAQQPLREIAALMEMDAAYLGWLLRNGRVVGTKRGGRWYTTLDAVQRYRREVQERVLPPGRPRRTS